MVIGLSTGSDDDDVEVIGGVDPRLIAVQENDSDESSLTDLVEQPAKVMRIGTMIKQLLEEVRAAPLDEASRNRLRDIHATSIRELEDGLAPELRARSSTGLPCRSTRTPCPRTPSCALPRHSWSAGWKGCSTASKPRYLLSKWRRARSCNKCARVRCRPGSASRASTATAPDNTCKPCRIRTIPISRRTTRGWSSLSSTPSHVR